MDESKLIEITKKEYDQLILQSKSSESVSQLAAGIAHEIRNPLTTIRGLIQLLHPYLIEIDKGDYANIALKEIDRLNDMVFQFLNTTKEKVQEKKVFQLNKLIEELELLYENEAKLRNIVLRSKWVPEDIKLYMNENQLRQVLINVIKNAMEAIENSMRYQGEIEIDADIQKECVAISIIDNGCGMSPESIQNLFSPYYTTKPTGTGLGLSICKKIIEDNGGEIHIHSVLGKGTIIKVYLPLAAEYRLHA